MTEQEAEQYKALLIWAKALDAAAEAAQARVNSNLASNRDVAEGMRCALDSRRAEAMEDLLRAAVVPTELPPSSPETKHGVHDRPSPRRDPAHSAIGEIGGLHAFH